ncbi:hypothetical protein [Spiroplasma endosymbiont of Megaselia nigra]|uniref:hypothetical protein n=1 Tax=Spiroplasma endosymbiont of Megaselia nigra TaxID=2478537 RepID=UPI000F865613|nr:hypothetical protein [Spiroplasma endosymbiont of Megaselia nigra]RUO85909.1 hypothetical protein D9R21_06105 [Spiroplasma endosymbiont of Megaselia nigra]
MKKLLSLLSMLTISGTVVPTVIANVSYQKNKDLSELNLTSLNISRNKRNSVNSKHIFKTNGADIPTEQQIKDKIKEKNPQVNINSINVTNITENSAVVTITGFGGQKIINFTVDKSVPINVVIKTTHLGEIDITGFGGEYDKQLFKHFLKQLNSQLDINKINVTDITTSTIKVNSNDTNIYTGEINITYSRPVKLFIKNFELGSIIVNNNYLPTEQQIKDKLKELNPILINIINDFEVKDITSRNAKISFIRKNILSGEVVINFISNINLNKIITQTSLGEFITDNLSNPTEQQIKDKLKELNPKLNIEKINVENVSNIRAQITSSDTNTYIGHIIVDYSVSIETLNWK